MVKSYARYSHRWGKSTVINKFSILWIGLVLSLFLFLSLSLKGVFAASTVDVNPTSTNGWTFVDDNGHGGTGSFISGPSTPPLGSGSVQLGVNASNQGYMIYKAVYGGTKLSGINALSYKTYVQQGNNLIAPALQFDIDQDVTDGNTAWQGRLVYEPYQNGHATVTDGQWQNQDALNGIWWFSNSTAFGGHCPISSPCTLSTIESFYPNIGIRNVGGGGVSFKAGSGWTVPFVGNIDDFTFNDTTYNFEPDLTPPPAPTNLHFTQNAKILSCGVVAGSSGIYSTHLLWSLPDGQTQTEWKVTPTYPSGSHGTPYSWTSGTDAWIGANIGQGYGAVPHDQGTYAYSVQYKGSNGVWSNPATCNLVYDTVAPTVTVTPTAGSLLHGTVTFTITVHDSNLDPATLKHIWSYLYNSAGAQKHQGANVDLSTGTGTLTIDTTKLDDGDAWLDVGKLYDAAGNPSGAGDTYFKHYIVDNTAPSTPVNGLPNGTYEPDNEFDFTWDASTDSNGPVTYEYQASQNPAESGGILTTGLWHSGTLSTNMIHSSGAADGVWYWQVRAKDAAGNYSPWSQIWHMTIDSIPPADPTLVSPGNNSVVNGASITQSWSDTSGDVDHYIYESYNNSAATSLRFHGVYTATSKTATNVAETTYWWRVKAVDHAGHESGWSTLWKITVDNTAPTGLDNLSPNNGASTTSANLTSIDWTDATDPNGPISYYYESSHSSATNGDGSLTSPVYVSGALSSSEIPTPGTPEGIYYWHVRAADAAGNTSAWTSPWEIIVDNTAPDTPAPSLAAGDYTGSQSVQLSSSDSLSGLADIYYTTDGSTPTNTNNVYNGPITITTDTTLKAIAIDNAGNESSVMTASYGIAPIISGEGSVNVTTSSITLIWDTNEPATSRVIYDTVSHGSDGTAPNYGYAFSTIEDSNKVTSHSVTITGLSPGTTYYFRTVSHGSPESVSPEITGLTKVPSNNSSTPTFRVNTANNGQNGTGNTGGTAGNTGGAVLAANITTGNQPATDNGQVKSDTTNTPNTSSDNQTNNTSKSFNWWWLALVAAILIILYAIYKKSRNSNNEA